MLKACFSKTLKVLVNELCHVQKIWVEPCKKEGVFIKSNMKHFECLKPLFFIPVWLKGLGSFNLVWLRYDLAQQDRTFLVLYLFAIFVAIFNLAMFAGT